MAGPKDLHQVMPSFLLLNLCLNEVALALPIERGRLSLTAYFAANPRPGYFAVLVLKKTVSPEGDSNQAASLPGKSGCCSLLITDLTQEIRIHTMASTRRQRMTRIYSAVSGFAEA